MTTKNTTNYIFLRDFKPELYKLAVKMEEDLLIAPVSMLAYATRFLEYILYDVAGSRNHEVNRESGFVNNIYDLIQMDYLEYYLGDLMIKAYHFRNTSIHNTDISKSLKNDRKTAFELNKRLFDIADVYYKNLTNDYEEHTYQEPRLMNDSKKDFSNIVKQEKQFDKCIICGEPNKLSKSNFCLDCDSLLNCRDVLAKIIMSKGTDALLRRDDFDYPFKDQIIKDLIGRNVLQRIGNDVKIMKDGLDEMFMLTDKFMEIDGFLADAIGGNVNPYESEIYFQDEYPYQQVSGIVDEHNVARLIRLLETGVSHKNAVAHVDITCSFLDIWYDNKKSEFIDGNKDKLFVRYNELLIRNMLKSISDNKLPDVDEDRLEFWRQNFEGFSDELSERLTKNQLKLFISLFKMNSSKISVLNQLGISEEEFDNYLKTNSKIKSTYDGEMERRKRLMLNSLDELNFEDALEKSKLDMVEFEKAKEEFLNGNGNEFYEGVSQKLMKKYLNFRRIGKTTDEICEKLAIDKSEVELWKENDLFSDFPQRYNKIRLTLVKSAVNHQKTKEEILNDLEMGEDEFDQLIELAKGDDNYANFREFFQEEYYHLLIGVFMDEFRARLNVNVALNSAGLTHDDLKMHLYTDEELYGEYMKIKIDKIVSTLINKGKVNDKLLKKLDVTKDEYREMEAEITDRVNERQMNFITRELSKGELLLTSCKKVSCDVDIAFDWILRGTLGDEKFEDLAMAYWAEHLGHIDFINSEIREYRLEKVSRNKLVTANLKYDFEHWMKWGLIDGNNEDLTMESARDIIRKSISKDESD